jgi:HEAT repeat protein
VLFTAAFSIFFMTALSAEQREPANSVLVSKLSSEDPAERISAFYALERTGALTRSGFAATLLNLLKRENQLIESTLRESKGEFGVSAKYGEEYGEYYSKLAETCMQICDKTNPNTPIVLANSAYSPSSKFATELVRDYGKNLLGTFLARSRSDVDIFRAEALRMLGSIWAMNSSLSAPDKLSIKNAIRGATSDESVAVRYSAVQVLSRIGDRSDLPLLSRIADTDEGKDVNRGVTRYPVREEAQRAAASIRTRAQ